MANGHDKHGVILKSNKFSLSAMTRSLCGSPWRMHSSSFELEWMRDYEAGMKLSNVMELTLCGELNNTSHLALDMVTNDHQ